MFLAVQWHATLGFRFFIRCSLVPTELTDLTLECFVTLLTFRLQLGTSVCPGPFIITFAEKLLVAISMTVAGFAFIKALTDTAIAVVTDALP